MYNDIIDQILKCKKAFLKIGEASQNFIELHDVYIEKNIKDSSILKNKMKEKVVRVLND
jgi:hypothetical protein